MFCSSSNLDDGDQGMRHDASGKQEEKKRRSSVFSKLGSYRQKKVKTTFIESIPVGSDHGSLQMHLSDFNNKFDNLKSVYVT